MHELITFVDDRDENEDEEDDAVEIFGDVDVKYRIYSSSWEVSTAENESRKRCWLMKLRVEIS